MHAIEFAAFALVFLFMLGGSMMAAAIDRRVRTGTMSLSIIRIASCSLLPTILAFVTPFFVHTPYRGVEVYGAWIVAAIASVYISRWLERRAQRTPPKNRD